MGDLCQKYIKNPGRRRKALAQGYGVLLVVSRSHKRWLQYFSESLSFSAETCSLVGRAFHKPFLELVSFSGTAKLSGPATASARFYTEPHGNPSFMRDIATSRISLFASAIFGVFSTGSSESFFNILCGVAGFPTSPIRTPQ